MTRHALHALLVGLVGLVPAVAAADEGAPVPEVAPPSAPASAPESAAPDDDPEAEEAALDQTLLGMVLAAVVDKYAVHEKPNEPPPAPKGLTDNAPADLHAELDRVEGDLLTFGVFPNSSGFMDAKLYFRKVWLGAFSSGVYFDYLTFQLRSENGDEARSETLDKEYRGELDAVKGIMPLHRWLFGLADDGATLWTLEPALNAKVIVDDIESSGYRRNGLGQSVFLNEEKSVAQLGASAKIETSLAVGQHFALDACFEYLPLIYSQEDATKFNSQFPDAPIKTSLTNGTSGLQATLDVTARELAVGKFVLRGRLYRNAGRVNTQSALVAGNFETSVKTTTDYAENTDWIDLTHTLTYLKPWTKISPAVSLMFQRRTVETNGRREASNTYKVGLLAEFF